MWGILASLASNLGGKFIGKFFKSKDLKTRTIADWEHEAIQASKGSWKDEYLTLVFSSPIVLQIIGALVFQFTGDIRLLSSADYIYSAFDKVGLDYTQVMLLIIGASFGVHVTRTVGKTRVARAAAEIAGRVAPAQIEMQEDAPEPDRKKRRSFRVRAPDHMGHDR